MTQATDAQRVEAELVALRELVTQLRAEQQQMAAAIQDLVTTFRNLATHLGIAAEPYARKESSKRERDLPGFA